MERVRYADNVPVVYEVASIPERLIKMSQKKMLPTISLKHLWTMVIELERANKPFLRV